MSAFGLKVIAAVTMFIDHIAFAFATSFSAGALRAIGRISFPLYAYLVSESCRHTSSLKKYLQRLGIFALISEIPYDLFFGSAVVVESSQSGLMDWSHQNIFFTLFLGVFAIYLYEFLWNESTMGKVGTIAGVFTCMVLGALLNTDFGFAGVELIFFFYILKDRVYQMIVLIFFLLSTAFSFSILFIIFSAVTMLLIWFYNGERGKKSKWFFYVFYPAHLLFLLLVFYVASLIVG